MKNRRLAGAAIVVCLALIPAQAARTDLSIGRPATGQLRLPLIFESNVGQLGSRDVRFAARAGSGTLRFADEGVSIAGGTGQVRWRLRGAQPVVPEGVGRWPALINYFKGSDPARWHTHVPTYSRVRHPEVYRGIDVEYYGQADGLEFDVHVAAGADPRRVRFAIDGAPEVRLDRSGAVVIDTVDGPLTWKAPVAYQEAGSRREFVAAGYVVEGREVRFRIGRYDRARPLVIDPLFAFSTLVGADSDVNARDVAYGVAADADGFVYVAGTTTALDFPNTGPAGVRPTGQDAFVVKLTPDGSARPHHWNGAVGVDI